MNVNIVISHNGQPPVGLKAANLEHLVRILQFQAGEKGMVISGSLVLEEVPNRQALYWRKFLEKIK